MSLFLERKYISLISSKLEKFSGVSGNVFKFRCPYCLDSKKNKNKARGYLYEKKGAFFYCCHNCGVGSSFPRFLRFIDKVLYNEFKLECFKEKGQKIDEPVEEAPVERDTKSYDDIFNKATCIDALDDSHTAKKFLLDRYIPSRFFSDLYYTNNFPAFVNNIIPNKIKLQLEEPRIIIPLRHNSSVRKNVVHGFQGRALDPKVSSRYITISLTNTPKCFGLNTVDFNRRFYVLEGPFDAMFLDNSIAICGSDFITTLNQLACNPENAVLIYDNEPRNMQVTAKIESAIKFGYRVVIWPRNLSQKDINDMIKVQTLKDVREMLEIRTFQGLRAMSEFVSWKKTKTFV